MFQICTDFTKEQRLFQTFYHINYWASFCNRFAIMLASGSLTHWILSLCLYVCPHNNNPESVNRSFVCAWGRNGLLFMTSPQTGWPRFCPAVITLKPLQTSAACSCAVYYTRKLFICAASKKNSLLQDCSSILKIWGIRKTRILRPLLYFHDGTCTEIIASQFGE